MAHFFIDRPIFAWVIAILIMLFGVLAINSLPISQYPNIAPPEVTITAVYPGASAKTIEDTVVQVIEQKLKGIDNLNYIYSTSDSSGQGSITLSFDAGTNPDIAQVQVQNKLQLATPLLPEMVQRQGVTVMKSTRNFLMVVGFYSEDGSMSEYDIADYVSSFVLDPLSRVRGVGDMSVFGSQYAMRVWIDVPMLEKYQVTVADITSAITSQNAQIPGGQIGGAPAVPGQPINFTVIAQNRLQTVDQFNQVLVKVRPDGSRVLLKDVAKMELSGENILARARYNRMPASGVGLKLASGANALETAAAIQEEVQKLSQFFPKGLKAMYPYDTAPFVRISIQEVVKTLIEAIILVFLVMYVFLQDIRATIIPTIAVPVVLLGTFGTLAAFGFTINTLTMFAMVLAIGLLVDDAIVVVENVERVMREDRLGPRAAARKSMSQITGALVGIALVLSAVFLPMAFFGGSVGVIYRQFSVTIVSSMILSVVVAMVLTPALCAQMLKPHQHVKTHEFKPGLVGFLGRVWYLLVGKWLDMFFAWFNRMFESSVNKYFHRVRKILRRPARYVIIYVLVVAAMGFAFVRLPTAFLPEEDQGIMFSLIQLEPGATFDRSLAIVNEVEEHFLQNEKEAVESLMCIVGFSFAGNGQNNGMCFIKMRDWKERDRPDLRAPVVAQRSMGRFSSVKNANIYFFMPPAVMELGTANGFDFELLDRANLGHDRLMEIRNEMLMKARQSPVLQSVRPNGLNDAPQYQLDFDLAKAAAQGVDLNLLNSTITSLWGSYYVNDFLDRGRTKKVFLQADAKYRTKPEDLAHIHIRNNQGQMVSLSSFTDGHWVMGSPRLERYNGVPSIEILGEAAPGRSSGDAMLEMERIFNTLPPGVDYAWTSLSYQEKLSGSQAPMLYALSILVVFLCLAALYESWAIPFSVMLIIPLGVIGALGGAMMRGLSNDVYFQVGLLTIIGLSAKNAILIVEFAKELEEEGMDLIQATLQASKMRLRPILMTSFAFILGVLPLAISKGAGSGSQNAIGTGVMCGMITATFLGIYLIPLSFVMISRIFHVTVHRLDEGDDEDHPKPPESPSGEKQYERFSAAGEGI
ncbi:multidrug efflux system protein [uncultured delta proteobacterium]|uniref:Multidrug efflux system protein n=1 Tax=uncultured delta proteobacterium TaxID=34034 RepID=A0A212IVP6_9DELT|nr:multidrug efflux system protein [uncultured delta proteobacterium]